MRDIVEQAKQRPCNATPVWWDNTEIRYPGVNTCLTITTIGDPGKMLVGMHLGLFMGAGKEGGKGSENSKMIDLDHLMMYLGILKLQSAVKGGGTRNILVAGAIEVWQTSAPTLWKALTIAIDIWTRNKRSTVDFIQFDDSKSMTVNINVTRAGIQFSDVRTHAPVNFGRVRV